MLNTANQGELALGPPRASNSHTRIKLADNARIWADWLIDLSGRLCLVAFAALAVVEATLVYRLHLEMSGNAARGLLRPIGSAANAFASPFHGFDTVAPIRPSGVIELSTLVAMEGYLVAALGALLLFWCLRTLLGALRRDAKIHS